MLPVPITLHAPDGASALVHPQGAHLARWQPAGSAREQLFVSRNAIVASGTALRGGVPVIFPQFAGMGPLAKHGFARTSIWQLREQSPRHLVMGLEDSPATRAVWDTRFALRLSVHIGSSTLRTELEVRNSGSTSFSFTAALHSYLAVDDVEKTELEGLKDCAYTDSTAGGQHKTEQATHLRIQGEVDRNYLHTPAELRLHEGARTLHISQEGFGDTVVWNPGAALAARMSDLAADEYRHFLCVEAAAIAQPIVLAPGARWRGSQTLSV